MPDGSALLWRMHGCQPQCGRGVSSAQILHTQEGLGPLRVQDLLTRQKGSGLATLCVTILTVTLGRLKPLIVRRDRRCVTVTQMMCAENEC